MNPRPSDEIVIMDLLTAINSFNVEGTNATTKAVAIEDLVAVDSKDISICCLTQHLKYYRITVYERKMSFWFLRDECHPVEQRYLAGEPIMVDFHDVIKAEAIWKSSLAQSKTVRAAMADRDGHARR